MTKRTTADKQFSHQPNRSVVVATGTEVTTLDPADVHPELIGLKAMGLLCLPEAWVPPFFVISSSCSPSQAAIEKAALMLGIGPRDSVWVRSSGSLEGMAERGSLESKLSSLEEVSQSIITLQGTAPFITAPSKQAIHFVVQRAVVPKKQGHLANERRLQRHARDWTYEVVGSLPQPVGVRKWRDASLKDSHPLTSDAFVHVPRALRAAAAWVGPHRAHLEWVWDGDTLWIVQLDLLKESIAGVDPKSLVSKDPRPQISAEDLLTFKPSILEETKQYPKLNNARLYAQLGYQMPTFYVLSSQEVIDSILHQGSISAELYSDLEKLCIHPFVLRTDASGLPPDKRQMLPRSDELRSPEAAVQWLSGAFKDAMAKVPEAKEVALIGHHFIPAVASAWCKATPDGRRARIESLWGIPEGLYCFAHDVFDVDTIHADLKDKDFRAAKILHSRERYKGKFVAPNDQGEWRVHETSAASDWKRSIANDIWVKEIAWTSRRIAIAADRPVVVMWFVGVHSAQKLHAVMPWYHEEWKQTPGGYKKAVPRTKRTSAQIRHVSNDGDWKQLLSDVEKGTLVERMVIDPQDESIIRSRDFVTELANHAKKHAYVIELSGGLLSHFYYMLSKEGCNVECVDLFGVAEEEIEYNKLVRDKIPEDIENRGEAVQVYKLQGDAMVTALKRKVVEEAYEVLQASTTNTMAEELADLNEVVETLLEALKLNQEDIRDRQKEKREKRGGFSKGLMLAKTSLPPPIKGTTSTLIEDNPPQIRSIKETIDLPRFEPNFHVDQRIDSSGVPERQITVTLSTFDDEHHTGEHQFDLFSPSGELLNLFFNATVEREGGTLKLKVRLTNAATQLELPMGALKNEGSGE